MKRKDKFCLLCGDTPAPRRQYCAKCRDPALCVEIDCTRHRDGKRTRCRHCYYEFRANYGKRKVICTGGCGKMTTLGECRACKRAKARKRCIECREEKLLVSFNVRKTSPDGKASRCKSCTKHMNKPKKPLVYHPAHETLNQFKSSQLLSIKW